MKHTLSKPWMLYGANGYTGRLIVEEAHRKGLSPILAGRNRHEIEALAKKYSLESRVFGIESMSEHLESVSAVLLAAGPFVHTSEVVVKACLSAGIHYLDITGEISVYETLYRLDKKAKDAGSVLLPGVGFDVVPSDCLAALLAKKMPDACELELAFSGGKFSKGTAKTMVTHLRDGGAIREHGVIKKVGLAYEAKDIAFGDKVRHCMTIPWGDVSTAYHSTGIENIRVFTSASPSRVRFMRRIGPMLPLLGNSVVQKILFSYIDAKVKGPNQEERQNRKTQFWGQVKNAAGKSLSGTLSVGEGYALTAKCSVEAVERIGEVSPGFQTPSKAFGSTFISGFEGCKMSLEDS